MANYSKKSKNKKTTKFIINNVPLVLTEANDTETDVCVVNEILDVLNNIPFDRFSIPLNANREFIFNEPGNTKSITVGFIKSFDFESATFNIVIFDTFKDVVGGVNKCNVDVNFGIWNGHLSKINRLVLTKAVEEEKVDE